MPIDGIDRCYVTKEKQVNYQFFDASGADPGGGARGRAPPLFAQKSLKLTVKF
jgi:hypothetical protein